MDRVTDYESAGWGFDSLRAHHTKIHSARGVFCVGKMESNPKGRAPFKKQHVMLFLGVRLKSRR